MKLPYLGKLMQGARLMRLSARLNLTNGKADEAVADCATIVRIRNAITEPALMSMLVRVSIDEKGFHEMQEVMNETEPSAKGLEEVQKILGEGIEHGELAQCMRWERTCLLRTLELFLGGKDLPEVKAESQERVKRILLEKGLVTLGFQAKAIELAGEPWYQSAEGWKALMDEKDRNHKMPEFQPGDPESVAWMWLMMSLITLDRTSTSFDQGVAEVDLMRIAIALRLYRMKKGEYPEKLGALASEFLKKLPVDPFSGKDYVYRRQGKGFIVYSLNKNMKDDGGVKQTTGHWDDVDIVWECGR
jgi:hypothetical protein